MKYNDIEYIEKLIGMFYEAETSFDEEMILYQFFSQEKIPVHLEKDRKLFLTLVDCGNVGVPPGLNKKLNSLIDRLESESENGREDQKQIRFDWKKIARVAAGILIILSVGVFAHKTIKTDNREILVDTFANPENAYIETQKTLLYVSTKLNKGLNQIESVQKNLDKTNRIMEKNIKL